MPFSTSLAVVRSSYLKNPLSKFKNIMRILLFILFDIVDVGQIIDTVYTLDDDVLYSKQTN